MFSHQKNLEILLDEIQIKSFEIVFEVDKIPNLIQSKADITKFSEVKF